MAFEGNMQVVAGAGLLVAGAAGVAGSLQVEALKVVVCAGLAFGGGVLLLKVCKKVQEFAGLVKQGVEALEALKDTAQQGMQAMEALKVTAQGMQVSMEGLYDRIDKCGNKLEVM